MALARADHVRFSYPGVSGAALDDVSLEIDAGEVVLLLGRSGCGKTTLLRAFGGLIPHFHGGRFAGRVVVGGLDTRRSRPADLVGVVATLFQDPEDQVVFDRVAAEVSFGLENAGVQALEIEGHVMSALAVVGAGHLVGRRIAELSGGEVQRICLASTLALNPSLLLLDEPTSQLDPAAADGLLRLVRRLAHERGTAVLLSEQRVSRALAMADRVVVMHEGAVVFDGSRSAAGAWLATDRPSYLSLARERANGAPGEIVCILDRVAFAYSEGRPVFEQIRLELRRGEIVALTGTNGVGKTTLGKLAAGLLEPTAGTVECRGRCAYLLQDPGRYLVRERCDEEVALGATSLPKAMRALGEVGLAGYEERHPRDLSSGERERLALAAVLATDPDVLVLDEPTRGIDPDAKQRLAALLRTRAHGRATLVASHDPDFLRAVADRTVSLPEARQARAA